MMVFRSGDGGFVDDKVGCIGRRLNDIVKTGGERIAAEIDQPCDASWRQEAAMVGIPHEKLGEIVVTCVVRETTEAGEALDEGKVRSFASVQLSSYKVPRRVLFILESELEFTATNKAKRGPLRVLAAKRLAEG
jgi:fatty-acyl-CoA synthase